MPKETEELQKLTVVVLRDLAKKRLGPGTSKLRTKAQLIAALSSGSGELSPAPASSARRSPGFPVKKPAAIETRRAAMGSAAAPDLLETVSPEPLVALPLDGQTLLVRWKAVPVRAKGERWELEVTSDGQPVRTVTVAPQSRQAHVRALPPGPVYQAKLIARDANGRSRVIGSPSRPVVFFPQVEAFPSTERFVRYSWSEPASSAMGPDQPAPGDPLPGIDAVADSASGAPLGWLVMARLPTSFAN
jgi:hypothetical protein